MASGSRLRLLSLLLVIAVPAELSAACPSPNPTQDETAAGEVVDRYVAALFGGDLTTLAAIQGGALAASKGPVVANPGYALRLRSLYEYAQSEIVQCVAGDNGHVRVDVAITLNSGEVLRTRFHVVRARNATSGNADFHIEDEETF